MMIRTISTLVVCLILVALLPGCAVKNVSKNQYDRNALTSAARTIEAEIVSKRSVSVDASSGVGSATGGALGAVGGSSIGNSARENIAGAIAGAVAGAAVGAVLESSGKTIDAYEYIVKSDVAGLLTIVQTDSGFSVGDKVYVVLGAKPLIVANRK